MNLFKRIAKLTLTLCMALVMITTTSVFAEENDSTDGSDNSTTSTTGKIVIKGNDQVSVKDTKFVAYRILDLIDVIEYEEDEKTPEYVYAVPEGFKEIYKELFWENGNDVPTEDFDYQVAEKISKQSDMYAFGNEILGKILGKIAENDETAFDAYSSYPESDETQVFSGLPAGYYVIYQNTNDEDTTELAVVSAVMLNTLTESGTITIDIKADIPTVDKKIVETDDDGNPISLTASDAAIGDTVHFQVTSRVPQMAGYSKYYFIVTDTLSKGLTFQEIDSIKIGEQVLQEDTYYTEEDADEDHPAGSVNEKKDFNVTATTDDEGITTVKIVFRNFISYSNKAGKDITINYHAEVNKDAVIGGAGNPNEVQLTYSNNPNVETDNETDEPSDKDPVGKTPVVETVTYITELEIHKVNGLDERLSGAEFKLEGTNLNTVIVKGEEKFVEDPNGTYWKLTDGSYTQDDPNDMNQDKYESTETKYIKTTTTTIHKNAEGTTSYTGTVDENGVLRFTGLSAGEYTISEIKAPEGYNKLDESITVEITLTYSEKDGWQWQYALKADDDGNSSNTIDSNVIKIVNQSGVQLPSTGGMGTTMFYVIGGILVVGAVILLITKKRMDRE